MNPSDLKNMHITVMGLGEHGGALGNIIWLARQGALLTVTDLKTADQLSDSVNKINGLPGIKLVLGEHRADDFSATDLVLISPAVPRNSAYLTIARNNHLPVMMDSALFFDLCPSKNIIGVTGSKGKSSTTATIAKVAGAWPIGLEGTSPLAALDKITPAAQIVFELSSWRLEDLNRAKISPPWAVVTSLYPDHLNSYESLAAYEYAKKTIIRYQNRTDCVLLNGDDARLANWQSEVQGNIFWYSSHQAVPGNGIGIEEDWVTVRLDDKIIKLFEKNAIPFSSTHELRNVLPAIFIAYWQKVAVEEIVRRVSKLQPLDHRLEKVWQERGIIFINDSAATIPDATIAALRAFSSRTIVHILGGNNKNLDYSFWAREEAKARIRRLIWLPGNANAAMKKLLQQAGADFPTEDAMTMAEAVSAARQAAQKGDVVLLSPGATSFGSFKHEFDRGEQFKKAVKNLVKQS